MSLRTRILLGCTLLVVLSFYGIMSLIMKDIRPRYLESVEESMVDTVELLAAMLSEQISANGTLPLESLDAAMRALSRRSFSARIFNAEKNRVDLHVYITDANGILLYDSTGKTLPGADFSRWRDVYLTLRGQYGARSTRADPEDPASSILYVAAPLFAEKRLFGVVTLGKPQDSVTFFIDIARKRLRLTIILIGVSAVGVAALMSLWVTWPLRRLIAYVRSVRGGKAGALPELGSSEIGILGEAVGEMQSKLEGKNYIEDYVRSLTHEMKGPLTGIRGAAEIVREQVNDAESLKFLDNIDAESARMQHMIERLLQLSRLENVKTINKTRIQARRFFEELAESLHTRLREKNQTLAFDLQDGLSLHADAFLVRQAVSNLLFNAMDFSPSGSIIRVAASKVKKENESGEGPYSVEILVRDQGEGIPEFALNRVFDKFFSMPRPGSGKKSSGLGLSFVKEVIALHGGEVRLRNLSPGFEVSVLLP